MNKVYLTIILVMCLLMSGCSNKKDEHDSILLSEKDTIIEGSGDVDQSKNEENTTSKNVETIEQTTTSKGNDAQKEYIPNGCTPQLLIDVFINDESFIYVEEDSYNDSIKVDEFKKMSDLNYYDESEDELLKYGPYRVVDLDGDVYNEVITDIPSKEALILHFEDDKVYGYVYPWRGIATVYESGIFEGSSGASNTVYSVMNFDKCIYKVIDVVGWNDDGYFIDGKEVLSSDVESYLNSDKFKEEVPYWSDYDMILTTK